jgi:hypothetical protein
VRSEVVHETCSCGATTSYTGTWPSLHLAKWRKEHRHEVPAMAPEARFEAVSSAEQGETASECQPGKTGPQIGGNG